MNQELLRILKSGAQIHVTSYGEVFVMLKACDDLSVRWYSGANASQFIPPIWDGNFYPFYIGFHATHDTLTWGFEPRNHQAPVEWALIEKYTSH